MTNTETISKLNNALNTLINAYEELQEENSELKKNVEGLETALLDVMTSKEELEDEINNLNDGKEEDNSNINTMLGKIESLLTQKVNDDVSVTKDKEEVITKEKEDETKEPSLLDTTNEQASFFNDNDIKEENETKPKEDEFKTDDNKIDLNRMASLLNGFNN
jgi:FtsZ-binding cell division protein ZapB